MLTKYIGDIGDSASLGKQLIKISLVKFAANSFLGQPLFIQACKILYSTLNSSYY